MQAAVALGKGIKLSDLADKKGYESLKISMEKWK